MRMKTMSGELCEQRMNKCMTTHVLRVPNIFVATCFHTFYYWVFVRHHSSVGFRTRSSGILHQAKFLFVYSYRMQQQQVEKHSLTEMSQQRSVQHRKQFSR